MSEPSQTSTPQKTPKQHPTLLLLKVYHQKLTTQQQQYQTKLNEVKQHAHQIFEQHFHRQFALFETQFHKQKHNLSPELKSIEYYLQNFIDKHALNPRENNLYPLFNQIDHKLHQNLNHIQSNFHFHFTYPQSKDQLNQNLNSLKAQIMEKELQEIRFFLAHNQNIRKHCNQELRQIKQIHDAYGKIYSISQQQYFTPELIFTGTYDQLILTLGFTKNIEKFNIGIKSKTGKMAFDQLKHLTEILLKSRNLLTQVSIKIMDMEFEEQKCNLIKGFVKELKVIKNFKLQNYYKENKLGMFEDFNWYPLKKETHIIGKVW